MNRKIIIIVSVLVLITFGGCGSTKQIKDSVTVEAGEKLILDASDFFETNNFEDIVFDYSTVNTSKVGEYTVTATDKKDTYTISVTVVDTIAPKFELAKNKVITNNVDSLVVDEFINNLEDVSATHAQIEYDEQPKEDGDYVAYVVVTDECGNSSKKKITVVLDKTPPVITGVKDITVEQEDVTAEPVIDDSQYSAEDGRDGEVICETSLEKKENQEYILTVRASDEAGNETIENATVTVIKKKETKTVAEKNNSVMDSDATNDEEPTDEVGYTVFESIVDDSDIMSYPIIQEDYAECGIIFTSWQEVYEHMVSVHGWRVYAGSYGNNIAYYCGYCGAEFPSNESLHEHTSTAHPDW